MKINLRKASAIVSRIVETMKTIDITTEVSITEFEDVSTALAAARNTAVIADNRRKQLLIGMYNLRSLIGAANATSGVDLKLANSALLTKRIEQLSDITSSNPSTSIDILTARVEKIKNRSPQVVTYGIDSIDSGVFSTEQIENAKTEVLAIKKQKQDLNDEILELNIKTEIELSDQLLAVLKQEQLV